MKMQVVEFTGPEQLEQLKDLLKDIIELADYNVRIAIDSDGFKVSIDRHVWSPGYPRKRV
jgi:hypothetical protein